RERASGRWYPQLGFLPETAEDDRLVHRHVVTSLVLAPDLAYHLALPPGNAQPTRVPASEHGGHAALTSRTGARSFLDGWTFRAGVEQTAWRRSGSVRAPSDHPSGRPRRDRAQHARSRDGRHRDRDRLRR